MVSVKILKNRNGYVGFTCKGHAGSDAYGKDLVCCATSTLVINTINSIDELTDTKFEVDADDRSGFIDFRFVSDVSRNASLLMDSMILGLKELARDNKKYVTVEIKEV